MTESSPSTTSVEETLTGDLRIIGLGTCGTVFEQLDGDKDIAVKKGKDVKHMWNDFCLTNIVHNAINDTRETLQAAFPQISLARVPRCHSFSLPSLTSYWDAYLAKFPSSHREVGAVFHAERIPPIPRDRWTELVDDYFEKDFQEDAKRNEENNDCLLRVYLGEEEGRKGRYDSMRNFPMRLDMIEKFGEKKSGLAKDMAITLAVIHWQAQVDAMDAEFVLGGPLPLLQGPRAVCPSPKDEPYNVDELPKLDRASSNIDVRLQQYHELWVLDFDKSHRIALKRKDVNKRLVPAFLGNDPYYPRPDTDPCNWAIFSVFYKQASEIILKNKGASSEELKLPKHFIYKVLAKIAEHEDWNAEDHIVFE
ncbi:MAG: hypothetical protein Q9220_002256 [cf. Caloplaca sp. 1 TL-2023]